MLLIEPFAREAHDRIGFGERRCELVAVPLGHAAGDHELGARRAWCRPRASDTSIDSWRAASMNAQVFTTTRSATAGSETATSPSAIRRRDDLVGVDGVLRTAEGLDIETRRRRVARRRARVGDTRWEARHGYAPGGHSHIVPTGRAYTPAVADRTDRLVPFLRRRIPPRHHAVPRLPGRARARRARFARRRRRRRAGRARRMAPRAGTGAAAPPRDGRSLGHDRVVGAGHRLDRHPPRTRGPGRVRSRGRERDRRRRRGGRQLAARVRRAGRRAPLGRGRASSPSCARSSTSSRPTARSEPRRASVEKCQKGRRLVAPPLLFVPPLPLRGANDRGSVLAE